MMTRRLFLQSMALVALSGYTRIVFGLDKKERTLNLYNVHTGERLDATYYSSGIYDHDAMSEINNIFRCHYTNEVKPMDVKVVDLLCDIKDALGKDREVLIVSGYRSHVYNEYLLSNGKGVVSNSMHLQGRAIDFRIPRVDNHKLATLAKSFYAGGVGKYPEFVHIDDGRVRYW